MIAFVISFEMEAILNATVGQRMLGEIVGRLARAQGSAAALADTIAQEAVHTNKMVLADKFS